jgi:predicted hotdog family 3-hydroxylacyl-ACP dehydratase
MLAKGEEILEFIPQRPPVVMIDTLFFSDEKKTISGFTIAAQNIFCEAGVLSESGLVENIAQTAAAGVGYVCKTQNKSVPIGFIAAIKDLNIYHLPSVDENLITTVILVNSVMGISIIKGTVIASGKLFADCEMRIFVKPD